MKRLRSIKPGGRSGGLLALLASVIFAASVAIVAGAGTNAPVAQAPAPKVAAAKPAKPARKPKKKKLTGAQLYQINCNRCHAERYPTEFTPAQWKTIMIAHACPGQPSRGAGQGDSQIPPGRQWKLKHRGCHP